MDILLNGKIDGISAAGEINARLGIPVVFLTAHADSATLAKAKVTQPYGYVLKPFKALELKVVIELALYRSGLESKSRSGIRSDEPSRSRNSNGQIDVSVELEPQCDTEDQGKIEQILRRLPSFNELAPGVLKAISRASRIESYVPGEFLITEGEQEKNTFLVTSGRVGLLKSSASGKDLIVELVFPNDLLSLLIGAQGKSSSFSARAQVESTVVWMPYAVVSHLLDDAPELGRNLIESVLDRLRRAHDLSRALAHDRVEMRVASVLLSMSSLKSQEHGQHTDSLMDIALSRQELADMTGIAPETASRVANAMERNGLLDLSQTGVVRIKDKQGLMDIMEH